MTSCIQQIGAYEKSLQLIEEFVHNGSLQVSEKAIQGLYNTYEKLVDMSNDSNEFRFDSLGLYRNSESLAGSKKSLDVACEKTEKRVHPRVEVQGYMADIIQGGFAYTAYVQDASLKGFQLQDLPSKFYSIREEKFTVIVSNIFDSMHYKLTAHSKWRNLKDGSVAVGFQLVDAPASWNQLFNTITS
ncbi:MAG: hypothetical protein D3909_14905 [Candidatus Electrothrix sp. ATG1]|nr:hypothetical protein [Candidatus Electrothrix sp. ATG1]MCI5208341.1 hypothetical protein [Candidatus Electrothrix sp. ATG2]